MFELTVSEEDLARLVPVDFDAVWKALGLVVFARAEARRQPERVEAAAPEPELPAIEDVPPPAPPERVDFNARAKAQAARTWERNHEAEPAKPKRAYTITEEGAAKRRASLAKNRERRWSA